MSIPPAENSVPGVVTFTARGDAALDRLAEALVAECDGSSGGIADVLGREPRRCRPSSTRSAHARRCQHAWDAQLRRRALIRIDSIHFVTQARCVTECMGDL